MELQNLLIARAAEYVRPGGRLVYSVCTVTPEENEVVIGKFLKKRIDFKVSLPTLSLRRSSTTLASSGLLLIATARTASSAQSSFAQPD